MEHLGFESRTFPGTTRDWWVYVPADYEAGVSTDINLLVFQDGAAYIGETQPGQDPPDPTVKDGRQVQACVALDNLHSTNEIPLTIAVFINPGSSPAEPLQRSVEYDTLSPLYSEFLLSELLPLVDQDFPGISDDPLKRCIVGASSGGIAAFTVAWWTSEKPGGFGRVISHVGSFTNIRGGHNYPWLVRNTLKKPIARVFLQGGANDLNNQHGNWPLANQQMATALEYAGYDVRFVFGTGAHSYAHGGASLPDALRWIWGDAVAKPGTNAKL